MIAEAVTSTELGERLQRYARYVALVGEQLEAANSGDVDLVRRLAEERSLLEGELTIASEDSDSDGPETPQLTDYLQVGISELAERLDNERRTQETWSVITDEALRFARTVPAQRIARGYPELTGRENRLDLRF
jgi:hypothetical protein